MRRRVNDVAERIKDAVNMYSVLDLYGLSLNRRGFAKCPFHDEDTPSLGVFAEGKAFNCFGCGTSGDVIAFVMKLFSINFQQALMRIDTDFSLGLIGQKADPARLRELLLKRDVKRFEEWCKEQLYYFIQGKFKRHQRAIETLRPTYPHEPLDEDYLEAIHNIEWCEYWLEQNR